MTPARQGAGMAQVLDYSAGFPGARAIRDKGFVGAVRYIGFPDRVKCTNARELADFTANGIGMALVYEDHADDWRSGYNGGAAAARRARDHANAIGFPAGRPIYMAVDRDVVTEDEFRAAMAYLRGAASVLGAEWVGVYGEHDVCARAAAEGAARWFWQCRAWSGTPVRFFAGRHLYQHVGLVTVGGIGCDFNDVLQEDWGQHLAGDDMPSAQEVADAVWNTPVDVVDGSNPDGSLKTHRANAKDVIRYSELAHAITRGQVAGLRAEVAELKATVAKLAASGIPVVAEVDVAAVAKAVNDEDDRRDRDGNPSTGSPS